MFLSLHVTAPKMENRVNQFIRVAWVEIRDGCVVMVAYKKSAALDYDSLLQPFLPTTMADAAGP